MRIITRAGWGARQPKTPFAKVPLSARTATCVHHDGSTPVIVRSFAEACARVRADEAYHMNHNGWAGIGYNYLVISAPGVAGVDGLIFEGRGRDVIGAHCLNHNTEWIGVQVAIGGGQTPSPAALASVRWLHDGFEKAAGRQLGRKVHSDGFATACPGPFLKTWVHSGMQVRATLPGPASPIPTIPTPDTKETDMPLTLAEADLIVKRLLGTEVAPGMVVATALQRAAASTAPVDLTALAKAIVASLPAGGSTVTAEAIAKAVADEQYRRQEA